MKEKLEKVFKKKIGIIVGFLILIIVILFGGAFLYNKFFYKRSYTEIENIMLEAGKRYYSNRTNSLPVNINDTVSVSVNDLVSSEEMKPISFYLKDESISCSGNVNVTNVNGEYRYVPVLDCNELYKTKKFTDYIQKNVPVVTSGNGLYNLNDELVYRGDTVDNYLKFSNKLYRIVKFSNGQPVIIYTEKLESRVWDNRYNIDKESTLGINDYSVSRIREYLDNLYKGTTLVKVQDKLMVAGHNLEIGRRRNSDVDKTGSLEKAAVMENQFIGLLPIYDFLNASLDVNCKATTSASCMNYNYLSKYKYTWWTTTASSVNSYKIYRIGKSASLTSANSSAYVRPVLYLAKDALYVSGNGSKENPYIVK